MKKVLMLVLIMGMMASPVFASDIGEGMAKKATRGVVNLFTGIIEFPVQIMKGYNNGFDPIENEVGSKTVGTVLGFFRGIGHAGGRMSWGALELFGFWAANPIDNDGVGVPLDAELAWEDGEQYSIFEPNLGEGIKPIGRKLGRGLANGFLGIAELPGQIKKGVDEDEIIKGTIRGFWYWMSRGVYGLGDIYSCIVPNPEDNPGHAFEEEWPWDAIAN